MIHKAGSALDQWNLAWKFSAGVGPLAETLMVGALVVTLPIRGPCNLAILAPC